MHNIARTLAYGTRDDLRCIRVLNQTLNATNGHILIRRPVDAPDGLYKINLRGELVPLGVPEGNGLLNNYPDLELIKPAFDTMKPLCTIPREVVGNINIRLKDADSEQCSMSDAGLFTDLETPSLGFPFNLPTRVFLNKVYLSIIMTEMMQYEAICLLREIRPTDGEFLRTPLVFGLNWGSCALIMPMYPPSKY